MEYDRCLLPRVNIVTVVGYAVDSSTTGLYGWINGEYLDGSGWVPDNDYVATERPWYIDTMESDDEITFVEPYVDM